MNASGHSKLANATSIVVHVHWLHIIYTCVCVCVRASTCTSVLLLGLLPNYAEHIPLYVVGISAERVAPYSWRSSLFITSFYQQQKADLLSHLQSNFTIYISRKEGGIKKVFFFPEERKMY